MEAQRMSADDARDALVKAFARLLKKRPVGEISVREVAKLAGVNHGLVHRYFGSKEGLVAATVRKISDEIHKGRPDGAVSASSFAYLREHPEVARLVARSCLDGPHQLLALAAPDPKRLAAIAQAIGATLDEAGLRGVDPHLLNGVATAALLGWFAFQPLLKRGFGLPDDADDRLAGLLGMLDQFLVGATSKRGKRPR